MATGRDPRGKFIGGNPGGPGRPRRETERAYLTAMSAACPLDAWSEIVKSAVDAAKKGDAKAREWLAQYLLGTPEKGAPTLHDLAVDEEAGRDPVAVDAEQRRKCDRLGNVGVL